MKRLFALGGAVTVTGLLFWYMHWPGGRVMLLAGGMALAAGAILFLIGQNKEEDAG